MMKRPGLLLLDADGVLWRGASPLPHAAEFVTRAVDAGIPCALVSNNSTKDRAAYATRCAALGIPLKQQDIFSSNYIAGPWLARERRGQSVLVLGAAMLHRAVSEHVEQCFHAAQWLRRHDITEFTGEPEQYERLAQLRPDIVLSGMDTGNSYLRQALACIAIEQGAELIGTNDDISFPVEGGWQLPGSGAQLTVYEQVCGVEALVLGKPGPALLRQIELEKGIPISEMLMIGDRPETDIEMAVNAGIPSMLVLTGVTDRKTAESLSLPTSIISDLAEAKAILGI